MASMPSPRNLEKRFFVKATLECRGDRGCGHDGNAVMRRRRFLISLRLPSFASEPVGTALGSGWAAALAAISNVSNRAGGRAGFGRCLRRYFGLPSTLVPAGLGPAAAILFFVRQGASVVIVCWCCWPRIYRAALSFVPFFAGCSTTGISEG